MKSEQDRVFFYNYSLVIGLLAVIVILFVILARYFGIDEDAIAFKQSTKVALNTVPVGRVNIAGEEPEEPIVAAPPEAAPVNLGQKVYEGLCISCHNGLPGIPKVGDKAAWESRIALGLALLYEHAIKGFISDGGQIPMPPKGGNPSLTDEEVKAAVDYMVENSQ